MDSMRVIHNRMLQAAQNADDARTEYDKREVLLKDKMDREFDRDRITNPTVRQLRMSATFDTDHWLNKYHSRWNFWHREQVRLGQLIMAHKAYIELAGYPMLKEGAKV
jgi:hypothetical protein